MSDELRSKVEMLRREAAECDLIAFLANDDRKQALFRKLAADLRMMAGDIEATASARHCEATGPAGGRPDDRLREAIQSDT